jgi:hypothetical protein
MSADWSSSEWDDEVLEVVSAVNATGICQSALFGHQPLVVEAELVGDRQIDFADGAGHVEQHDGAVGENANASKNESTFSALCHSLCRRGWALLARRVRGGGRVVLLPAGEDRLVMQHVLTKELVLPLEEESESCDAPLHMEKTLESVKYADCYNPLQEDGQLVALLTQKIHEKKGVSFKQSNHLEMNNQEKRKNEDQGLRAVKKYQLPIKIIKHH